VLEARHVADFDAWTSRDRKIVWAA
jgi:hypothetical protein